MNAGKIVTVTKEQPAVGNLYAAGAQVMVSAPSPADVVAAGGDVTVNGATGGSVLVAGGNVSVLNDVRGSIRALGGQVAISGNVGGDIVVAGGTVTVLPGSTVAGDVLVAGGTLDLEGNVNGQVRAYGGTVTINGVVHGPVHVEAAKTLTFGSHANLEGALTYSAPQAATVTEGAVIGTDVVFTRAERSVSAMHPVSLVKVFTFFVVLKFLALLLAALVLAYSLPRFTQERAGEYVSFFWKRVVLGFASIVAFPVACIVLLVTGIGMYFAFLLGVIYLFALIAASVYAGIFAGALLARWLVKEVRTSWPWITLGVVALFVVAFIPFLGWIAVALLYLASFGMVLHELWRDARMKLS